MPPAKRAPSSTTKSAPSSAARKPAAKKPAAKKPAAKSASPAAKATATTARKSTAKTTTQAKTTDSVTLTREHVQATLDDAAARGRITRKDANELVTELMRRGRQTGDEVGDLLHKGAKRFENVTRKARKAQPVDRLVRGADRARRAAGVGPAFPIVGYDDLNVGQVQTRLKELSKPDQRKVLTYERRNANRKSIVGALEKSLG
jgi:polyhydroxyalkanoate synthesis regulator phasin